ncbi:ankyrin repeat domain-containing protein [Pedosphaera parvula]|uniref:Ankyrin n=1 Tax=Pedosphaera parvula (strain Ellin514) TaxID=320771 RepID=B9XBE0_PEDPL|nr:ankyrin repeat domain-containing protein [Pedosphaera parvula]EEF62825.1 Ankyrin [Pedosphaera parvula Ellin514]
MEPEVQAVLERVKETADFGYVDFSDINTTNELGDNALHCVIVWGDYEAAKILLAHGINVNQKGEEGYTPLHLACSFGHKEIVQLLLEHGADTFARTAGDLPFTTARLTGNDEICELLRTFAGKGSDTHMQRHTRHLQALSGSIQQLEKQIDENCEKDA